MLKFQVPGWLKYFTGGFTVAVTIFTAGYTSHDLWAEQRALPARVERIQGELEEHIDEYHHLVRFLVCERLSEDASSCTYLLRGTAFMEDFIQRNGR